jgi:carbamoyltransferase
VENILTFSLNGGEGHCNPEGDSIIDLMDAAAKGRSSSLFKKPCAVPHFHKEIHYPHSLGLLYSAFLLCRVNSGEYKLMGLAPAI